VWHALVVELLRADTMSASEIWAAGLVSGASLWQRRLGI
jgi:hypothetical protein